MSLSTQAFAFLSVAVSGVALVVADAIDSRAKAVSSSSAGVPEVVVSLDIEGIEPIQVECVKKPVPILTVYQY